jgi:hypothetical protein
MSFVPSFPSYETFLAGLGESLSTEFFGDTYPKYYEECNEFGGFIVDAAYITHFLKEGLDPQVGLEKMVDCLCEHSRYALEHGVVSRHIDPFLAAGANMKPLTHKLVYIPQIKSMHEFEDAMFSEGIAVRAAILDTFWKYVDHEYIQAITDWSTVKPKYWEYIPGAFLGQFLGQRGWKEVEPETLPMAFYRAYKCYSDYLRGEHERFAGSKYEEGERYNANREFMEKMMGPEEDENRE